MTTKINPQQISVGPIEEVEPPPIVAGGQVWRNGMLVDRGAGYAAATTTGTATADGVQSVEAFIAARRQQENDILDAGARGDPALLFALLQWALRETSAPSHADLAGWMEEGRRRLGEYALAEGRRQHAAGEVFSHEEMVRMFPDPPPKKKRVWTEEGRARMQEALARGRATQRAKEEVPPDGVND